MIKKISIVMAFTMAVLIIQGTVKAADPIEGMWYNIADEGEHKGKTSAHMKIFQKNGIFYAQIVKLLLDPPDTKCDKCKGAKKDKPVQGMIIAWGLKKDGPKEYTGGKIMDPENGKTYGCKMELLSNNKLKVRGFVGISLFGRNQYWFRLK